MVFARYVMFSDVYWHHAVRSATAMFQRAFYLWYQQKKEQAGPAPEFAAEIAALFELSEFEMVAQLRQELSLIHI